MARDYALRQVEHYRAITENLQTKYGMTYEQFEAYLKSRSATLAASPNPTLNQAVIAEEEDALDWKIAREMLQSWLGLQTEVGA
jgi:translation initiation factor 2 alpha subunit (eIF-2alpha)